MSKLFARIVSHLPVQSAAKLVILEISQKTLLFSKLSMLPSSMGGNVAIIVVASSNWRSAAITSHAIAVLNSVTLMANGGRLAPVHNGTKTD